MRSSKRRSMIIGRISLLLALAACAQDPVSGDAAAGVTAHRDEGNRDRDRREDDDRDRRHIAILDACDPRDPGWAPTGGCVRRRGDVTLAEFNALLVSPFAHDVVGHPAWRNQPSYLSIEEGDGVRVRNEGGRNHTFTWVAQFGGGRVPPLNQALAPAPECLSPDVRVLAPGDEVRIQHIPAGLNRYQCCIHPWMRAAIRVSEHAHGG